MNTCILLLSFNHQQITAKALKSIQKHFSDEDIVLVHNGSMPDFVNNLKQEFPHIHHLIIPTNLGYSGGMNAGFNFFLHQTSKNWCLALTNDTELVNFNQEVENLKPALVAPIIYFKSLKKIDSFGGRYHAITGKLRHIKNLQEPWNNNRYIPGTAMFFHRDIFKHQIFFDQKLFTFWEDVLWSQQLELSGVELLRTQDIKVAHAGGKSTRKDPHYTSYFYQRNRLVVSCKLNSIFLTRIYITLSITLKILKCLMAGNFAKAKMLSKAIVDANQINLN